MTILGCTRLDVNQKAVVIPLYILWNSLKFGV